MKRLTREELRVGALMYPPVDIPRPTSRAECKEEMRPCPWVACKHHLYLDINPETGSIKINFPDLEPWELKHTCALDVAERGGITLEEVGEIMNLTRERIRQVEVRGLLKLKMGSPSPDELGAELLAAPKKRARTDVPGVVAAWYPRRMIRRALISVSDKRGVVELGKVLAEHGVEILSTGGTAAALAAAGVPVDAGLRRTPARPRSSTGASRRCTRRSTAGCSAATPRRTRRRWRPTGSRRSISWW